MAADIPTVKEMSRRWRVAGVAARAVACPFCGAAAKKWCRTTTGRERTSHVKRVEVYPGRPRWVAEPTP
jgi:hypothetical protein